MQNYFEFIGSIGSSDHISSLSILKLLLSPSSFYTELTQKNSASALQAYFF